MLKVHFLWLAAGLHVICPLFIANHPHTGITQTLTRIFNSAAPSIPLTVLEMIQTEFIVFISTVNIFV